MNFEKAIENGKLIIKNAGLFNERFYECYDDGILDE